MEQVADAETVGVDSDGPHQEDLGGAAVEPEQDGTAAEESHHTHRAIAPHAKTNTTCPATFKDTVRKRLPPKPKVPPVPKELQDHRGGVAWQKVDALLETHHSKLEMRRELYFDALRRKVAMQRRRMKELDDKRAAKEAKKLARLARYRKEAAEERRKQADLGRSEPQAEPYNPTVSDSYLRVQHQYREMMKARQPKVYIPASARYVPAVPSSEPEKRSSELSLPQIESSTPRRKPLSANRTLASEAEAIRTLFNKHSIVPPPPTVRALGATVDSTKETRLQTQADVRQMIQQADTQIAKTQQIMAALDMFPEDDESFFMTQWPPPTEPSARPKRRSSPTKKRKQKSPTKVVIPGTQGLSELDEEGPWTPPSPERPSPRASVSAVHTTPLEPVESEPAPLSMHELSTQLPSIVCGPAKMWRPPFLGTAV